MITFLLFMFGLAVGSFLNVVSLRYKPDKFLFDPKIIGGRSRCPHCRKILCWYELIPVVSFVLQKRHCNNCEAKISFQYPLIEIVSGLIFVAVPWRLSLFFLTPTSYCILSALWICAFLILLLISLIDIRLGLIPDESDIILLVIAILIFPVLESAKIFQFSFLGGYAAFIGFQGASILINRIVSAVVSALFFGGLVALTRGRGMGIGDIKLGAVLGLLFGWPDTMLLVVLSFIIGAIVGIYAIFSKGKTMKSSLPFGPFLATGAATVFFVGFNIVQVYLGAMGLNIF